MCYKIFVVLAIVLTFSTMGCALKCYACFYSSNLPVPTSLQYCNNVTVDCPTKYCYSVAYTTSKGISAVRRGCDNIPNEKNCPNSGEACQRNRRQFNITSCSETCCTTDLCNSDTVRVMAAKFILCLTIIVGYFLA
ncbi:Hypothetical predicted protein [Paramuricea clavata]|uniref:Uncharacterized protein n=2 Tax=Paramuricea clavata TaxID=317549 RepID=A0A6S7GFT8_PARCT|nr:Hypothetical predicted protein [Paramuricea clavata]